MYRRGEFHLSYLSAADSCIWSAGSEVLLVLLLHVTGSFDQDCCQAKSATAITVSSVVNVIFNDPNMCVAGQPKHGTSTSVPVF